MLIELSVFREKSLRLPLIVFPMILPEWAKIWEFDEAALRLLGKAQNFIDTEVSRIHGEGRELTPAELRVIEKHLYQTSFCLFIIQRINKLTRESIMPESFTGDLMAILNPHFSPAARKKYYERLLQKHLKGKPLPYPRFKAIRHHIMEEINQLMAPGNITWNETFRWWAMSFIPEAAEKIAGTPVFKLMPDVRKLQNVMSSLMTKALLGPGWSIRERHKGISNEPADPSTASDKDPPVMAMLELESLLSLFSPDELAYFEAIAAGKSQVEVAAELGVKAEAVRQKVSRARKKVRTLR
jgi:DNA-binding CsgD family transcriptional regulator